MDFRKYNETYYIRMDKGDKIISGLLDLCKKEHISSAIFSGIGGCKSALIQTFIPQEGEFETQEISGMLELISLNGNIITQASNNLSHHTHAMFSYKEGDKHLFAGGHMKEIEVLYTAEIELHPIQGGVITKKFDSETGTGFWNFQ